MKRWRPSLCYGHIPVSIGGACELIVLRESDVFALSETLSLTTVDLVDAILSEFTGAHICKQKNTPNQHDFNNTFCCFDAILTGQLAMHPEIFYMSMLIPIKSLPRLITIATTVAYTHPHFRPLPHDARDFNSHSLHAPSHPRWRASLIHNNERDHIENRPRLPQKPKYNHSDILPRHYYPSTIAASQCTRTGNRQQRAEAPPRLHSAVPASACRLRGQGVGG